MELSISTNKLLSKPIKHKIFKFMHILPQLRVAVSSPEPSCYLLIHYQQDRDSDLQSLYKNVLTQLQLANLNLPMFGFPSQRSKIIWPNHLLEKILHTADHHRGRIRTNFDILLFKTKLGQNCKEIFCVEDPAQ